MTFLAQIRPHAAALTALPARLLEMHHNTIPRVRRIHVRADFRNSSRNLVTRDEGLSFGGLYLVEEVQVRSADAGGVDLNEDFLGARARIGDLNDLDNAASLEPDRSHDCPPLVQGGNDLVLCGTDVGRT